MASKRCVLFVDDEEMMRKLARAGLELGGFEVITASSGEEALACFKEASERVSCALLDFTMPGGMNGMETGERLRAIRPDLPLILMSGYDRSTLTGLTEGEHTRFLEKPFGVRDLLDAIHALVPGD